MKIPTVIRIHISVFLLFLGTQVMAQNSANDLIERGNQKEEANDYKGAFADFNNALLISPENPKVLYYSGFIKFQLGDYANAISDYNLAMESDSESVELYYCRGNAYFELNFFKEAIFDYSKAILLDSTDSQSFFNRAIAKYTMGETAACCKDLQSAIKYGDKEAETVRREICR